MRTLLFIIKFNSFSIHDVNRYFLHYCYASSSPHRALASVSLCFSFSGRKEMPLLLCYYYFNFSINCNLLCLSPFLHHHEKELHYSACTIVCVDCDLLALREDLLIRITITCIARHVHVTLLLIVRLNALQFSVPSLALSHVSSIVLPKKSFLLNLLSFLLFVRFFEIELHNIVRLFFFLSLLCALFLCNLISILLCNSIDILLLT